MAEQEPVTIQTETARMGRLQSDLAEAVKAQEQAIAAMTKRQRDASIDEVLELAEAVRLSKVKCDAVQATINASKRTIGRLEWEAKSAKLTGVLNPIASTARQSLVAAKAIMAEFKVTGVVITFDKVDTEATIISVKPTGPDVPKPPSKGGGTRGGPRAARSSHSVVADGTTMTPREYVEAHTSEASPAIQEFLAGDTSKRVNITHEAERIAAKLGHTFS